jgi:rhodanese-related sulfurtransferase
MFGANAYKEVDAEFVDAARNTGTLLIDVRGDAEVAAGMIPGARHIPLHMIPLRAAELPRDVPVIFYCRTGARSGQACAFLAQQGFANLHNLAGGVMAWARAGKAFVQPHDAAVI